MKCKDCKYYKTWFDDGWSYQQCSGCMKGHELNESCPDYHEPTLQDEIIDLCIRIVAGGLTVGLLYLIGVLCK